MDSSNLTQLSATIDDFVWEFEETVDFLVDHSVTKVRQLFVALQFPDDLLKYSFEICKRLELLFAQKSQKVTTNDNDDIKEKTVAINSLKTYVLGDTTFAPCCVDEIAAQHAKCDAIVHYGNTCCSP
ncbi:hypothetical protein RFI_23499 [Reticulomyxa filosa]|uniref:Uncharacterized protein n=1 Tax=Reticulomyxa filosa TaxID=46433 RepID=X6MLF8_RETFI|nr:hypothetical protein RFI_23499 [Reticulomyxa filosa]|eukprot:ETO13870.1 hypothetical protein RFI_23499 [Reticulomyxa filosa]